MNKLFLKVKNRNRGVYLNVGTDVSTMTRAIDALIEYNKYT